MGSVSIVSSTRSKGERWQDLITALKRSGQGVCDYPEQADTTIVLGGKYENPNLLAGWKVLAFDAIEWLEYAPPPFGWNCYRTVLEEYYDSFLNLTGMQARKRVQTIIECVAEYAAN